MAYNPNLLQLTGVLQQLYRRLGAKTTTATAGSDSNTVVDSKLADELAEGNEDDIFNGGTLIVANTGDGLAPIGEFSRITDYIADSTSLELSPNLTANVESGDSVIIASPDFPLYDMIELVNDALRHIGEVPVPDTSITTEADKTEYTLPAVAVGRQLLDVEVQTVLGDADNNLFAESTRQYARGDICFRETFLSTKFPWSVPVANMYDRDEYGRKLEAHGFVNVRCRSIRHHVFPGSTKYRQLRDKPFP